MQQITETVSIDSIVWRKDLYPRFEPNPQKIQEYAESVDRLPPIEINQRHELIDGYHRWTAHKKAGLETVEAFITETVNDFELERLSYERNSTHGQQLMPDEKRTFITRHYNGKNADELARIVSVSTRTVKRWVSNIDKDMKRERDRKIREMWLACYTREEIAEETDTPEGTVATQLQELLEIDNWQKSTIFATYSEPDFEPPLYNIWSFAKKTNGTGHFGNTEQRIVDNLLYMHTQPFDIVVDPFAGGGSTIDVCKHRLRRYWVSDRLPIVERTDIRQHDIKDGPPPLHKRWSDVALMYLDPPYWRQAENEYSKDADDLANMPLEVFYRTLATFISESADKMRAGSHVALIIQPTQWRADDKHYPVDHVFDLVNMMRDNQKLRYKTRIICPYTTEQYNAQQVNWAKEQREVLTLNRELVIWGVQ